MTNLVIHRGFEDKDRARAAALYWQSFGAKLDTVLGPETRALAFLKQVIDPRFAFCAYSRDGELLGLAGIKTADGALVGGTLRDLAQIYSWWGTAWRAPLLALLERAVEPNVMLMDGICVAARARGQGVGTSLLNAVIAEAAAQNCRNVRLDVIASNTRARALYERMGFIAQHQTDIGPLRHIYGFASSIEMRLDL